MKSSEPVNSSMPKPANARYSLRYSAVTSWKRGAPVSTAYQASRLRPETQTRRQHMTAEEARAVEPAGVLLWVIGCLWLSAPLWEPPGEWVPHTSTALQTHFKDTSDTLQGHFNHIASTLQKHNSYILAAHITNTSSTAQGHFKQASKTLT